MSDRDEHRPDYTSIGRRAAIGGATAALAAPLVARAAPAEILVGAIYPLTGAMGQSGLDSLNAIRAAVDIINDGLDVGLNLGKTAGMPGLGGAKIRLVAGDHQGDPQKGRAEAERLITQEKCCGIVGASYSSVAAVVAQVCERYGVPFSNGDSSSPSLTQHGFKTYFRAAAHDEMFSAAMFDFLNDLKAKDGIAVSTLAIFYEDTLFGSDSSRIQRKLAVERGYKVVADTKYRASSPSLTSEVQGVKAADPDVFMPTSYINDAILMMKTMADLGYRPKAVLAQDSGFAEPSFLSAMGAAANGVISRGSFALDLADKRPAIPKTNAIYRKRSDKDFADVAARSFTGMMVMADGINRAGSVDPKAIVAALRTTNIPGVETIMPWPRIVFDEHGQNPDATPIMLQVTDGQFRTVWPFDVASTKVVWPMPR